ncbi:MAG TPA: sigma factor-like helix-turn-helix DNA-binding protein [Solirubrobacteraceae bacterium]
MLDTHPSDQYESLGAERQLVLAARTGHPDMRDRFVEAFLPLVGSVARIYRDTASVDRAELMQEGVVGLLRALDRFDPSRGTPFWAYASWWVRQAMQQVVSELSRPVVLSDRALRHLARLKDRQREYAQAHGAEPTLKELADAAGLTVDQVHSLFTAERPARALEEPVNGEDGGSTFGELLSDARGQEGFEQVVLRYGIDQLPCLLRELSERESAIVRARYGLDGQEKTLRELGASMGVSAERVRQIEQSALEKMRAAATSTFGLNGGGNALVV